MTPRTLTRQIIGDFSRYALVEFKTRDGSITWMVEDAEQVDPETNLMAIVAQGTEAHCRSYVRNRDVFERALACGRSDERFARRGLR